MVTVNLIINLILFVFIIMMNQKHNDDIREIHKEQAEERAKLLDRIMSNNIQEYKAATGQKDVKRSKSGNFLVDRMEKTLKNQFEEE